MPKNGKVKSITKDQYRTIYESKFVNNDTVEEVSKKSGVSVSYVVKILMAFRVLDDLDFVYSIPTKVLTGGKNEIRKYAIKLGKHLDDDPESVKKVDENSEFQTVSNKINESRINSVYGNSMNESNFNVTRSKGRDVITHYIPDYRRAINPKTVSTNYEYGGIQFSIDETEKTIIFKNLDSILTLGDDISCEPGEFNKYNIKTLISYGEALVGIGMFFQSFIK